MTISHNDIPNTIRTPMVAIEFDNSGAIGGTPAPLHKTLLISLKNENGTASPGIVTRTPNSSLAVAAFGEGSMGAAMARTYWQNNTTGNLFCMALEDDGTKAKGGLELIGSPTFGGTLFLYIAGRLTRITLKQLADTTVLNAVIVAAINAVPEHPVVASVVADKIQLECKWAGETGNEIDIRFNFNVGETFPQGVSVTITPMSNGTGAPDISGVIAAIGTNWYQHVIMPFTDPTNLSDLRDELLRRWGPMAQIDGIAYMAKRGTFGEMSEFGLTKNDHVFSCFGIGQSPTPAYIAAAAIGGLASKYLAIDPARPLQTLVLQGVLAPHESDRLEQNERNLLLYDGISTHNVNDGGQMTIERLITMYRSNTAGLPDPSYLDVMTPATLSFLRYATRVRITQKFPRHKLCDDETKVNPEQAVVKPKIIRAELIALYSEHEWNGLVENTAEFIESLVVERDVNDRNRVRVLTRPDLMNQFMVYTETCRFIL